MVRDPVCGMELDEHKAPAKTDYMNERFYFCSLGCMHRFEQHPERYVPQKAKGRRIA